MKKKTQPSGTTRRKGQWDIELRVQRLERQMKRIRKELMTIRRAANFAANAFTPIGPTPFDSDVVSQQLDEWFKQRSGRDTKGT